MSQLRGAMAKLGTAFFDFFQRLFGSDVFTLFQYIFNIVSRYFHFLFAPSCAPSFRSKSLIAHRALLWITGEGADLLLEAGGFV